jgi:hypothetical protein
VNTICPTMITPTTPILESGKDKFFYRNKNDQIPRVGQQLNSVQWTKLHCPSPLNTDIKPLIFPPININSLEPLETTYVSNIVRKVLAQHNIGQRLFARYVLSLSQGTVSELLSKPKPWSKLTEKGKESYRKMWSWANSEESISALKSISPRKGKNKFSPKSKILFLFINRFKRKSPTKNRSNFI